MLETFSRLSFTCCQQHGNFVRVKNQLFNINILNETKDQSFQLIRNSESDYRTKKITVFTMKR
jgi:hypothetical protein